MKKKINLILILLLFFICGCIGLHFVTYSKPLIIDKKVKREFIEPAGEVFNLELVFFNVSISNSHDTDVVLFPPIPWLFRNSQEESLPLRIVVTINPKNNKAMFNPQKIVLWKNKNEEHFPVKMKGPFTLPYIFSSDDWDSSKFVSLNSFNLKQNTFTFVLLDFDIKTFPPSKKCFVKISGLEINDKPYQLPVVIFKEARNVNTATVP